MGKTVERDNDKLAKVKKDESKKTKEKQTTNKQGKRTQNKQTREKTGIKVKSNKEGQTNHIK